MLPVSRTCVSPVERTILWMADAVQQSKGCSLLWFLCFQNSWVEMLVCRYSLVSSLVHCHLEPEGKHTTSRPGLALTTAGLNPFPVEVCRSLSVC